MGSAASITIPETIHSKKDALEIFSASDVDDFLHSRAQVTHASLSRCGVSVPQQKHRRLYLFLKKGIACAWLEARYFPIFIVL